MDVCGEAGWAGGCCHTESEDDVHSWLEKHTQITALILLSVQFLRLSVKLCCCVFYKELDIFPFEK